VIWSSDSVLFPKLNKTILPEFHHQAEGRLFKNIDAFWVPGAATQAYIEQYGVSKSRIFQGAYCLDIDHILHLSDSAKGRRQEIRTRLGVNNSDWLFLFVGRMLSFRGVKHLVEAFYLLGQRLQQVKLLLIGDGPEKPELEAACHRLGLSNLIFLNPVPMADLTDYYVAADTYVTAALREHYSLALAQAAICGLPMISTDRVGAVKDYVLEGETGLIVPTGNHQALAAAMARLASSRDLAQIMGQRAIALSKRRTITWAAEQLEAAVFQAVGW
jgi:glycosyltransferase involved in cell wall biosynthesis